MGPIVIDIDPVIFHIGHFSVGWYGVSIAVAIVAAFSLGLREARRKGIPEDEIYSMGLWAVPAGLIGARLLHVIDKWSYYMANPLAALAIQDGGLAILGAILGGSIAGFGYARRRGLSLGRVADAAVQIHGGNGYMLDYRVEQFLRDVRLYRLYEGTSQIQQLIIARELLKEHSRTR